MNLQDFRDGTIFRPRRKRTWSINWPVLWLGIVWWYVETKHYGWNMTAQSDAEMFCDGLVFLLFALSYRRADNGSAPRE